MSYSEPATSLEKDERPGEAGSHGGAPVGGAAAEPSIENLQLGLAEIKRILEGSGDAAVDIWAYIVYLPIAVQYRAETGNKGRSYIQIAPQAQAHPGGRC
jgi:hypothetical protein